jgi:hypothetical protein
MATNTDTILISMFQRLLHMEIDPALLNKLVSVIDNVTDRLGGQIDLDSVQGQNTLRALLCSMVVHGWGNGMHPFSNPNLNKDGDPIEVRVSKDILLPMEDLQSLRYIKKDKDGRVKKALFEPDQKAKIRQQIETILEEITRNKTQS